MSRRNQELLPGAKGLVRRQVVQSSKFLYGDPVLVADPVESLPILDHVVLLFDRDRLF